MSIEKSVNFLQPGGTFSCGRGDQGSQRFVVFRWPSPGDTGQSSTSAYWSGECSDEAKRECPSLPRSTHVAPLAPSLGSN